MHSNAAPRRSFALMNKAVSDCGSRRRRIRRFLGVNPYVTTGNLLFDDLTFGEIFNLPSQFFDLLGFLYHNHRKRDIHVRFSGLLLEIGC